VHSAAMLVQSHSNICTITLWLEGTIEDAMGFAIAMAVKTSDSAITRILKSKRVYGVFGGVESGKRTGL
jgi:hypothetical protein